MLQEEEEARLEEEERKKREEQEKKEQEEYERLKVQFEVEEEGCDENVDAENTKDLLQEFLDYIKVSNYALKFLFKLVHLYSLKLLIKLKLKIIVKC